jgi:hypothetical protein
VIRKYVLALSLLALPLGFVAATGSAANAAVRPHSTVTFTGKISCSITGKITAKPGLELTTPQTVTLTLSATGTKCTGSTSQGGATIVSGKAVGSVKGSYSCESLLSSVPSPAGNITWKTTGNKATPTAFKLSGGKFNSGPPIVITYNSTQTGSFAGSGKTSATIKQTQSQLVKSCESKAGLKSLTISSGSIS